MIAVGSGHAAPSWPTDGVGVCAGPGDQGRMGIVSDGANGALITWQDGRTGTLAIYAVRIDASGAPATGWPECGVRVGTGASTQSGGLAVSDGTGGVIVLWQDGRSGTPRIYAQRVDAAGTPLWDPAGVRLCDADSTQSLVAAVADGHGGVIAAWGDTRRAPPPTPPHFHRHFDAYCARLDASGARVWDVMGVPVAADSGERSLASANCVVPDGDGGALIVFADGLRGGHYAQHVDAAGARQWDDGGSLVGNIGGGSDVVADGVGGIWVVTSDGRTGVFNVWAEHLDANGAVLTPPGGLLVCGVTGEAAIGDRFASAAADDAGGVIIAWVDTRNGVDRDVFAMRVLASNVLDWRWPANGAPVCRAPGVQINPSVVRDGQGGAYVAWYDQRDTGSAYDIYAQRIGAFGGIVPGWPVDGVAMCHAADNHVYPAWSATREARSRTGTTTGVGLSISTCNASDWTVWWARERQALGTQQPACSRLSHRCQTRRVARLR